MKISAPVGLRNRTTNVANKAADQKIVISLLAAIGTQCGGQKGAWATPPAPGSDGKCPKQLAEAIWDFQTHWQTQGQLSKVDGVADPGGKTITHLIALNRGGCGPKVDGEFKTVLTKIQTDFGGWTRAQRDQACQRILIPLVPTGGEFGGREPTFEDLVADPVKLSRLVGLKPDINGWDVLPLFQLKSGWLRSAKVLNKGCASPTSPKPKAAPNDAAHENPCTCSDSVEIGGKCWLNGTVNYGTFGIMVGLCADEFLPGPLRGTLLNYAEALIRGYKQFINKEDPTLPIEWTRATFRGGPGASPSVPGNRPNCAPGCSLTGSLATWDYVWEPIKPRATAKNP